MASLTGINLDPNVEESGGAYQVLPGGQYKMVITKDNLHDNKKGNGKIWTIGLQVVEGHHTSRTIDDNINLTNPSLICQQIGQGTLKKICNLCGVQYPPADTTGVYGKPMMVSVEETTFISAKTGKEVPSNNVKSYSAVTAATPASPTPPQANIKAGGDAPW